MNITPEAIVSNLKNNEEELQILVNTIQKMFQSTVLRDAIHYFACFDAYSTNRESIDSSLFPSLNKVVSGSSSLEQCMSVLLSKEQCDLILDDLYCLYSFYQEKLRTASNEHSIVISCSDEITSIVD